MESAHCERFLGHLASLEQAREEWEMALGETKSFCRVFRCNDLENENELASGFSSFSSPFPL